MKRSLEEVNRKISSETEPLILEILQQSQDVSATELISRLVESYELAFLNALRHRANGTSVDNFSTYAWLAGSEVIVSNIPWLQFGMPRIKALAYDLKLPWIPIGNKEAVLQRAKNMASGLPCSDSCLHCYRKRDRWQRLITSHMCT